MNRMRVLVVERAPLLAPAVRDAVAGEVCDIESIDVARDGIDPALAAADLILLGAGGSDGEDRAIADRLRALPGGDRALLLTLQSPVDAASMARCFVRLTSAERQRRALMESAADAMLVTRDGTIREVNLRCEEILDRPRGELLGRPAFAASGEQLPVFERLRDVVGLNGALVGREGRVVRADGRIRLIELSSSEVEVDGQRVGLSIIRDITERRGLEAQLRQSQKVEAVGQLAGGVAHDFNNLLSVILAHCSFLADEKTIAGQQADDVEEIRRTAERATSLTRQLLTFSRKEILQPRALNLNVVIADVEKMLRRLIGEDVALETQLAPDLATVNADSGQLQQVVMNLAVNARDAMPTGGTLVIETANVALDSSPTAKVGGSAGPHVVLTVRDTGEGMDSEVLAHVFEPFFTTKEAGKGTGLGLSTVHGIVRESGGLVRVESAVGSGTSFHVFLPAIDEGAKRAELPLPTVAPRGHGETVLLVEDDSTMRATLRRILQQRGYSVLEARRGDEAVALAHAYLGPIHLLLADVVMPGLSGPQVERELRASRSDLRVLYVTGYTDDAIVRHGPIDSEVELLQKPFTPEMLARRIRDVLDRIAG